MTDVKFCGMTRTDDVRKAVELGAAFIGVVMTQSRRRLMPDAAAELLASVAGADVRTVGVFGGEAIDEIVRDARRAGVNIVQLHGTRRSSDYDTLKQELGVECWHVVRVGAGGLSAADREAFSHGDATLLDTLAVGAGELGGTGRTFDWDRVAHDVVSLRGARRLIVAGGLKPGNVGDVVERLAPDVVDVSSGVEFAPGVKDHALMADFMAAAATARK